jgi:hypothetical protein
MKSNKLYKNAIIFFCITSFCSAQDTVSMVPRQVRANSWTMEFGIASNFTLTSFQGTAVSVSKYVSDCEKIRIGISSSLSTTSSEAEEKSFTADTLGYWFKGNGDNGTNSIQFTGQYLIYASPRSQTSVYFAIGPLAGINWSSTDDQREDVPVGNSQGKYSTKESLTEYFAGILGSCGVEWFFSERMSLHAEYGIAGLYKWGKSETTIKTETINNKNRKEYSSSSSVWTLMHQNVLFGLGIIL